MVNGRAKKISCPSKTYSFFTRKPPVPHKMINKEPRLRQPNLYNTHRHKYKIINNKHTILNNYQSILSTIVYRIRNRCIQVRHQ
ncbi:hypothetical protein DSUL_20266 [Desulfovibrionales bacterium]